MKAALAFLLLGTFALGQTSPATGALRMELRASFVQIGMNQQEIVFSVFFRSPDKTTTIWNALWWGASTGLYLRVFDSSGHEVQHTVVPIDPMPPDLNGRGALISIGGKAFAGFDSQFATRDLFPHPGSYTVKCVYSPPLRRDYFTGHTIWVREDGTIMSAPVSIVVAE
jgi:hypothetical protein